MRDRAFTFDDFRPEPRLSPFEHIRRLRRLGSRWDLLGATALALAWMVLIVWTASGSESWQARVCADLTHRPRGCEALPAKKDESRIVPAATAAEITP